VDIEKLDGIAEVPNKQIKAHKPQYIYTPVRGLKGAVAVAMPGPKIIGWMALGDLPEGPFTSVRDWILKTGITM